MADATMETASNRGAEGGRFFDANPSYRYRLLPAVHVVGWIATG